MSERPVAYAGDDFEIVAHDSAPVRYPEETHATVQICIPMAGARYEVTRTAEAGGALRQDLGARDILLVPNGQPHSVTWLRRAGIVSLHISERFVAEALDIPRLTLTDCAVVRDRFVSAAATELYTAMEMPDSISPVFAEAFAVGVAHRLATTATSGRVRRLPGERRLTLPMLRRIERYVDDNLERQIGLAELAMLAGLSRWYFVRVFREAAGTSPHDFIMQRRLNRAQNLLRTTGRTVIDIAGEVGMTHSHFTRVFARRVGMTPTEFRRTRG